jgi:outer membrane protein assembly factor BamB
MDCQFNVLVEDNENPIIVCPSDITVYIEDNSEDYLYALRGNNSADFLRYDFNDDSWSSTVSSTPATVNGGGSMVKVGSDDFFVLGGNGANNFWKYDITHRHMDHITKHSQCSK